MRRGTLKRYIQESAARVMPKTPPVALDAAFDILGHERMALVLGTVDRMIPKLMNTDRQARQFELGVRLWIVDYVHQLLADLATEFRDDRLKYRGILFCTRDPFEPTTTFERPRALTLVPDDGKFDPEFVAHLRDGALAAEAVAIVSVFGEDPSAPSAPSPFVYVTLEFTADDEINGWAAPCIVDPAGRRLGPFGPTASVNLAN